MGSADSNSESGAAPSPAPSAAERATDLVLVRGVSADGRRAAVTRLRGGRVEVGELRPLEEGRPITGEVVTLRPRPEFPLLFDVDVKLRVPVAASASVRAHGGPARVATPRFRAGWDAIWGRPPAAVRGSGDAASDDDGDDGVLLN